MTNKLEQYFFVYDDKEDVYLERWKVVDNDNNSISSSEIDGHIKKKDLDTFRNLLKQKYSDSRYIITTAYGNCWSAIENNYRGLFYDHFSDNSPTIEHSEKKELDSQLPFSSRINPATQQGSFFILFLVACGIYWGWSQYLIIKGVDSTFSWLYQLVLYQPYHLLTSIHVPVFVGIGIYYIVSFTLLLLRKVIVNKDGLLITPRKKYIPWHSVKEVYAFELSDKYDEMPLFGRCLQLVTEDGQRINISNRFENIITLVELIKAQIQQPVVENMLSNIDKNGSYFVSRQLSVGKQGISIYSTSEQFDIDFDRISNIITDKELVKIYNLEDELIYQEELQSVKNAVFLEYLIKEIQKRFSA